MLAQAQASLLNEIRVRALNFRTVSESMPFRLFPPIYICSPDVLHFSCQLLLCISMYPESDEAQQK